MLPPAIAETFRRVPEALVGLCRPHSWQELTTPPAPGMRSIKEILVHLMDTEAGYVVAVIHGFPWSPAGGAYFTTLDSILESWNREREYTTRFFSSLTPDQAKEPRAVPWLGRMVTVADIVWHVITHEQYHRGQIFTRLALLGRRDLPDHDMLRR